MVNPFHLHNCGNSCGLLRIRASRTLVVEHLVSKLTLIISIAYRASALSNYGIVICLRRTSSTVLKRAKCLVKF